MSYAVPFRQGQKLVELGGGEHPLIRPNVDVRALPTVDVVADLSKFPLPLEGGVWDGVFASYVLEHVSWRKLRDFVAEVARLLAPNGIAVFVVPNTEAQFRWALKQDDWEKVSQCVFGDQDYQENAHRVALSPDFLTGVLRGAGFQDVLVVPHGEFRTDMIVEARKRAPIVTLAPWPKKHDASTWTKEQRLRAYDRRYFDGGKGDVGGYAREGYWDFPVHWLAWGKVMEKKPQSVLELGCARGYVLKRLQDAGVRVKGLEVSRHCQLTRAIEEVLPWDLTETPWPIRDGEFDLAFSIATLEHIPESALPAVARELARTCKRGFHGVDVGTHDDGFDKTHCTTRPLEWWRSVLPPHHEVVDKETLESGQVELPGGDGKIKLNVGSFTTMFHHGWINIDIHPLQAFAAPYHFDFRQHDVRSGLLFPDESVDFIFASHFLEHLTYREGATFLRECRRVMKRGAMLRIAVPNAEKLIKRYERGELGDFDELNEGCAQAKTMAGKLWEILLAGHSAIYDVTTLGKALTDAGLPNGASTFRGCSSQQIKTETLDLFPDLSLYFDAVKP